MAMAVAIDNSGLALDFIPQMHREIDRLGGDGRRFHIHRVSAYATIVFPDSELWQQLHSAFTSSNFDDWVAKEEALNWQADPADDLGDLEVLHHLRQQTPKVPLLSSVISQSDHDNAATTLSGSALSPSIKARTQGRLLSSFHRLSFRTSGVIVNKPEFGFRGVRRGTAPTPVLARVSKLGMIDDLSKLIVWATPERVDHLVLWQVQVDVVDLFSRRILPNSRPGKRRRAAFNPFLQLSDSPVVEDTNPGDHLPHARRYNGVRHRPDRRIWVAEMKPPKHKTKQDFGNFKSEAEAARAVDAAFHHYGRPDLLNFPDSSLQFLTTRPTAPPGLDEKAKVKFVKEEAKLLLAANAATSPLHLTHTNSRQILELSVSPRRCPSGHLCSFSAILSTFNCSGPDDADHAVSQPPPWMLLDSTSDISTTGVQSNLETLNSVQISGQGWGCSEDPSTLAAPPNAVNSSACEFQSTWLELDSFIRSPPAPMYSRSPSPSHFQDDIVVALLKQQSI